MHLINLPKKRTVPKLFPGFYWAISKKKNQKNTPLKNKLVEETRLKIVRISGQEPFLIWETWNINGQSPRRYRAMENCPDFILGSKISHYGSLNPNIIDKKDIVPGFYWGKFTYNEKSKEKGDVIIYIFGKDPFLKLLALSTDSGNVYTINNIDSIVIISRIQQPCVDYTTVKPIIKKRFIVLRGTK